MQSENRLSFSACFEEDITYVHCSVFPKTDAVIHVIFSTVSLVCFSLLVIFFFFQNT